MDHCPQLEQLETSVVSYCEIFLYCELTYDTVADMMVVLRSILRCSGLVRGVAQGRMTMANRWIVVSTGAVILAWGALQAFGAQGCGGGGARVVAPTPPPKPTPQQQQEAAKLQAQRQADQAALADARKELATVRGDLTAARQGKKDLISKLTKEFNEGSECAAARQARTDSATKLNQARATVIGGLKARADYQAAEAKEQAAQAKVKALRDAGASKDEILAASNEVLAAGNVTGKIVRDALAANADFAAAQKELTAASVALSKLEETFRKGLDSNSEVSSAKDKIKELESKETEALAKANKLSANVASR